MSLSRAGGPYAVRIKSQLNKQAKHTTFYNFAERIRFAEHGKLVAESSEFHFTLSRAHRAHFSNSKYAKKRDILSEKRDDAKSVSLRQKAVMLTPMHTPSCISMFPQQRTCSVNAQSLFV